jgi:uncharacterized membrane protein
VKKAFKLMILPILITAALYLIVLAIMSIGSSKIEINSYEADIVFNEQGDMTVTESFHMTYNDYYRVRFRDIDYIKFYNDYPFEHALENHADFDSTQSYMQVYKNGENVSHQVDFGYSWLNDRDELGGFVRCEPARYGCASMFVDTHSIGGLEGDITFEYHYVIEGVATRYSDISEINWNLFEYMESGIKEGQVNITLPEKGLTLDNFFIFPHGIDSINAEYLSDHKALITFNDSDKDDFLEFRLLVPNRLFPDMRDQHIDINNPLNKNMILNYEQDLDVNQSKGEIQFILSWVFSILSGLILYGASTYFYHKFFKPYPSDFKETYLREVPYDMTPAEMSYIFFGGKTSDEDVTATLLDLIRKKYIKIVYDPANLSEFNPNFKLELIKRPKKNELKSHETHLIKWFFDTIGKDNEVSFKTIEQYPLKSYSNSMRFKHDAESFTARVKQSFKEYPFMILTRERNIAKSATILNIFIFLYIAIYAGIYGFNIFYQFVLLLLFSVFYIVEQSSYIKRKKPIQEQCVRWEAFRRFLLEFGTFDDDPITNVVIWEHYLVYATSFKIADLVMKQLQINLEKHTLNEDGQTFLFTHHNRRGQLYHPINNFRYTYRHVKTSATHKIREHNREIQMQRARSSSRSGGRFGGFGGGSSFGGGGGGGRSR